MRIYRAIVLDAQSGNFVVWASSRRKVISAARECIRMESPGQRSMLGTPDIINVEPTREGIVSFLNDWVTTDNG